jgi:hypothetical protein
VFLLIKVLGNLRLPGVTRSGVLTGSAHAWSSALPVGFEPSKSSIQDGSYNGLWMPLDGFEMQTADAMVCDSHPVPSTERRVSCRGVVVAHRRTCHTLPD